MPGSSPARPATSAGTRRRLSMLRSPSPPTAGSRGAGSRRWSRPRSPGRPRPGEGEGGERARATFAKKLRGEAHGMASFRSAPTCRHRPIEAAVAARAEKLKETMPDATEDERRVHALLLMAIPAPPPTPISRTCCPPCPVLPVRATPDGPRGSPSRPRDRQPTRRPRRGPRHGHRVLAEGARATRRFLVRPVIDLAARRRSTPTRSPTDIGRPCI